MYRCEKCKEQSKPKETQFRLVTKKRKLEKGWEIVEEKKICSKCWRNKK